MKNGLNIILKFFKFLDIILFIFIDKNVFYLENVKFYKFLKLKDNVSIENIFCVSSKDGFDVLVEIKNRGIKKVSFEFEFFVDGKLVGLKNIFFLLGKVESFLFENIKGNYKVVWGKINYYDVLEKDNIFWIVLEFVRVK